MTTTMMLCPKCDGEMERGFTLDMSHGARFASQWVKGEPKLAWGYFFGPLVVRRPKASDRIHIGTFRCQSCGYLESYARDEFQPKS